MAAQRSTSLLLIVLTLVAGVALGWLLRDFTRSRAPSPVALAPTAVPVELVEPTSAVLPSPAPLPTDRPTALATPLPTETSTSPPTAVSTEAPTVTPVPPTATPAPPTIAPVAHAAAGYIGHTAADGETLASIAAAAGSTPDLIARYNLLGTTLHTGRALIVPQLAGQPSSMANEPILVQRGAADKPWVALTLDAGAGSEPVAAMLQTLRERNVKLTFFLTGKWIRENPDLTRQIVADGHEIANHTLNHPDLTRVGDDTIRKELAATEQVLREVAGDGATTRPFFRPPYGAYDQRVLRVVQGEGYLPIYWTLDSLDSIGAPKTPAFLLERVTAKLTPEQLRGAIILAHCGSAPTAEALPKILDRFAEMGFEVKKLSEVLP